MRDYSDYLEDIKSAIGDILEFTDDMEFGDFKDDRKTQLAVVRCLEIIGEAAKSIPDEIRKKHALPWKEMSAMRDKMIHHYFGLDNEIIWNTIKKDIPDLKKKVDRINEL